MLFAAISIFVGAGFGALLRWWFNLRLNTTFEHVPMGTLASNLVGGYLIGVAAAFFMIRSDLSPQWRLFVMTGFMGGLTTFSTFSVEVVGLLAKMEFGWALGLATLHLAGSLVLTALGMWTVRVLMVSP